MKKHLLASLVALLACTGVALSQATSPISDAERTGLPISLAVTPLHPAAPPDNILTPPNADPCPSCVDVSCGDGSCADGSCAASGPRAWASAEYLLWWVKSAPLPVPLATTAANPGAVTAAGLLPGALGSPGTVILSPSQQNFGPLSGGRVTVGGFFNQDGAIGFEGSGFLTESRTNAFVARSDATGFPLLAVPFIGTPPAFAANTETATLLAFPGVLQGAVVVSSAVRMWGAEANGVLGAMNTDQFSIYFLGGVRYLDLSEHLEIGDATIFPAPGAGLPFPATVTTFHDHFGTRNQICAGQVGARASANFGRLFVSLTGKVGLGDDHQSVSANGNRVAILPPGVIPGPGFLPITSGGIFTQGTNSGREHRDQFVVVPEVRLQVGVNLTRHVRAVAGYEFLYLNNVVRPGDQIDRAVNITQAAGGNLIGTPRPSQTFSTTDFFANGINAAIQLSF